MGLMLSTAQPWLPCCRSVQQSWQGMACPMMRVCTQGAGRLRSCCCCTSRNHAKKPCSITDCAAVAEVPLAAGQTIIRALPELLVAPDACSRLDFVWRGLSSRISYMLVTAAKLECELLALAYGARQAELSGHQAACTAAGHQACCPGVAQRICGSTSNQPRTLS